MVKKKHNPKSTTQKEQPKKNNPERTTQKGRDIKQHYRSFQYLAFQFATKINLVLLITKISLPEINKIHWSSSENKKK